MDMSVYVYVRRVTLQFFSVHEKTVHYLYAFKYMGSQRNAITTVLSENNVKVRSDNDGNYFKTNPARSICPLFYSWL